MRFKTTWVLLVIVLLAAGYFLLVEQPRHQRERERDERETRLTTLPVEAVSVLVIRRPDETLRFEPEGEDWRMVSPVEDRADRAHVNTLLHTLLGAEIERRFRFDEDELREYGLDAPEIVIGVEAGDSSLTLALGDLNVTKAFCYGRRNGEGDVLLLPAGLRRYAARSIFEFRYKKILDFDIPDVKSLTTATAEGAVEWTRVAPDQWVTTVGADTVRADVTQIKIILGELRSMRAQAFQPDSPENNAAFFSPPRGTASIVYGPDDARAVFVFSEKLAGRCYVKLAGGMRIALVDGTALDFFNRSIADLRDRRVVRLDRESIASIEIMVDGSGGSIHKRDPDWSFANPELGTIPHNRVMVLLYRLEGVMFREVVTERLTEPGRYGLDAPAFRVSLFDADGRLVDELLAGEKQEQGNVRYATSRSSGHLGIIDEEPLQEIRTRFDAFKVQ